MITLNRNRIVNFVTAIFIARKRKYIGFQTNFEIQQIELKNFTYLVYIAKPTAIVEKKV